MANRISRRGVLTGAGVAAGAALLGASPAQAAPAARPAPPTTPDQALARLLEGNRRFAAGHARHRGQDARTASSLAGAQHPYAIVLACSDSREVPEVLFDAEIGAIFDQRVAGNIVDDALLGSMEFAVTEFAPPVLVVLGHERCGAVTATVEVLRTGVRPAGHVGVLTDAIAPAVAPGLRAADPVEAGVVANARQSAGQVLERSPIIAAAVAAGTLRVVAARYDLDDEKVTVLG